MESSKELELRKLMDRLREKARRKVPETDAEDLVQEVMVVLVERLKRSQVDTIQAYAEGILRHVVYDYYQRKKERTVSLDQTPESEANGPSPEQRVVWQRHLRVIDGLAQENKIDRALVDEHFVKGEPLREVATQLKVSPGVVNGRLFRFRQKVSQRVGSCFATIAAIMVGLWSRGTRALVAARAYSSVVGVLSVGSFATWMWWPQGKQPAQQPQAHTATAPTQASQKTLALATPAPFDLPGLREDDHFLPTQIVPADPDTITITPVALPYRKRAQVLLQPKRTAAVMDQDRAALSDKSAPTPAQQARLKAAAQATMAAKALLSVRGFLGVSSSTHALTAARTQRAASTAAAQRGTNAAPTGSRAASATNTTKQTATPQGQQPSKPGSSKPGGSGTPSNPKPVQPNPIQPKPGTPTQPGSVDTNFLPTKPGLGPDTASMRAGVQLGTDGQNTHLPDKIVTPTKKRSFCVVQDGRIYNCGGTLMTDITGTPNSGFTCGTNKYCTQMIGQGPSLLFSNTGELYVLGHHLYRKSEDGGTSWQSPSNTKSPAELLKSADFILHHTGVVWQQKQTKWHQARPQQTSTHEVRVHVSQGQVNFEDDTGFKLGGAWQTIQERRIQAATPSIPDLNSPKQVQPNIKPETSASPLHNAPAEQPIPVSMP